MIDFSDLTKNSYRTARGDVFTTARKALDAADVPAIQFSRDAEVNERVMDAFADRIASHTRAGSFYVRTDAAMYLSAAVQMVDGE